MRTGDAITVQGKEGKVVAQVLDERATGEMPAGILPLPEDAVARAILAEEYSRAAVIGYRYGVERIPVMFVALEDKAGTWWDLQGHVLEIAPASSSDVAQEAAEAAKEGSEHTVRRPQAVYPD